ncbi:TF29 protein, partial [Geococcyx californianus]|nr:TF29 protein [Geococcyx californianus]
MHSKTHWGTQALVDQFTIKYMCIGIYNVAKGVVRNCLTCQKINKQHLREQVPGGRDLAHRPFAKIQVDFTDLPKAGQYKHLLVIVDHLTHYVEAFPTPRATANTVVKILLEYIMPRYGNIETIDSDRGPHFISKVVKNALAPFGTKWQFHTPWHPQSSGKVERMNGEIKKQLTKLIVETNMSWVKCLPIALLNIRTQPRTDTGISPFEMLYGMPYDLEFPVNHPTLDDSNINTYIVQLMKRREELRKKGMVVQRPPLEIAMHNIKPGDMVLIKSWKEI